MSFFYSVGLKICGFERLYVISVADLPCSLAPCSAIYGVASREVWLLQRDVRRAIRWSILLCPYMGRQFLAVPVCKCGSPWSVSASCRVIVSLSLSRVVSSLPSGSMPVSIRGGSPSLLRVMNDDRSDGRRFIVAREFLQRCFFTATDWHIKRSSGC